MTTSNWQKKIFYTYIPCWWNVHRLPLPDVSLTSPLIQNGPSVPFVSIRNSPLLFLLLCSERWLSEPHPPSSRAGSPTGRLPPLITFLFLFLGPNVGLLEAQVILDGFFFVTWNCLLSATCNSWQECGCKQIKKRIINNINMYYSGNQHMMSLCSGKRSCYTTEFKTWNN